VQKHCQKPAGSVFYSYEAASQLRFYIHIPAVSWIASNAKDLCKDNLRQAEAWLMPLV